MTDEMNDGVAVRRTFESRASEVQTFSKHAPTELLRAVTVLWCCLLSATNDARAQTSGDYLVLDVAGRVTVDQGEISIGGTVAGTSVLHLDSGHHVTLLGSGIILSLGGPATTTPASVESAVPPRSPAQISWVAGLGEYLRKILRLAEYRAPARESARDFRRLHLTNGAKCVVGKERPNIFVPSVLRNRSAILLNLSKGVDAVIPLDAAVVEWPATLQISDDDRYEVTLGGRKLLWTFHVPDSGSLSETELISWMVKKDCSDQVVTYVRNLPPTISWSESR
jgi:hypothetical protein